MRHAMRKAGLEPRRQDRRGGQRGAPHGPPPKFPDDYFATDSSGERYLRPEFVRKQQVDDLARRLANSRPGLTTGQVRRFFNHCRLIERRLSIDDESWERVSASFESLSYHAQNAAGSNKIPRDFQDFIDANVKRVSSADNPKNAFLKGFVLHFEALVGYGAAHLKKES